LLELAFRCKLYWTILRALFRGVRVGGVTYHGATHSVTIRLAKPTKGAIRVIVWSGIMAADGAVSAGNFTAVVF